jgi:hypothetical protein
VEGAGGKQPEKGLKPPALPARSILRWRIIDCG